MRSDRVGCLNSTAASRSDWAAPPPAAASRCARPSSLASAERRQHPAPSQNRSAGNPAAAPPPAAPGRATPRPAAAGRCHPFPTTPRPSLRTRTRRINERDQQRVTSFLAPSTTTASCSLTATPLPVSARQAGAKEPRLTLHHSPVLVATLHPRLRVNLQARSAAPPAPSPRGRARRQSRCRRAPAVLPTARLD